MTYGIHRFLTTFDPGVPTGEGAPPLAAPPVAAPPAPVATPQAAAPAIDPLLLARLAAHQQLDTARAAEEVAAAARVAAERDAENRRLTEQVQLLRASQEAVRVQMEQMQLDNYRANAVASAVASGRTIIDSLVQGSSRAAIDASINVAEAEYTFFKQRILAEAAAQAPARPVGEPPAPEGYVYAGGGHVPAQPQQLGVPSYVAVPAIPQAPQQDFAQHLQHLTSPASIRNGDYARARAEIHGALRGQNFQVPQQWSLQPNGPTLQPPAPVSMPVNQQPAMHHNPFAGVSVPQVHMAGPNGVATVVQQGQPYGPPMQQTFNGVAPQPLHIDQGAALNVAAAAAAAQQAIAVSRATQGHPISGPIAPRQRIN